jgi:glycerol-3-phosphate dehydrogenase
MDPKDPYCWYGSDRQKLDALINEDAGMTEVISEKFPLIKAQVILAVREEMALTVEDCLSRRVRALQLDARESIRVAPRVAAIMAEEMGLPDEWIRDQVERFTELAGYYLLEC